MKIKFGKKKILKYVLYPVITFIIVFTSFFESSTTSSSTIIPHFSFNITALIFAINLLTTFVLLLRFLIFQKKLKIDIICLLLFLRLIFSLIPITYVKEKYAWGNLLPYILSLFMYFNIINIHCNIEDFKFSIRFFILLVFFQSIYIFMNSPVSYNDSLYKYYMVFPIGASNFASSIIALISLILVFDKNVKHKLIWYLFSLVTIFLTKSRASLIVYILVPLAHYMYVMCDKKISYRYLFITFIFFVLIIIVDLTMYITFNKSFLSNIFDFMLNFFRGFISEGDKFSFDDLFSGRLSLFKEHFLLASKNFLLGSGFTFYGLKLTFHNFLLEAFYVSGIVGVVLNLFLIFNIFRVKNNNYPYAKSLFISIFIILSIEKIAFTFIFDMIFWGFYALISKNNRFGGVNNEGRMCID